jgi:DNA-directed RNA polymerase alpha subunit
MQKGVSIRIGLRALEPDLARRAIRQSDPGLSEEDVRLRFVEQNYGSELATGLRRHLANRRP